MKAVILAGGKGTRLRPLTLSMPKPLVPLAGKPLVRHIIDSLPAEVDEVLLAVNYMKGRLQEYFETAELPVKVRLVEENRPLGTGGALKNLREHIDGTFLAFNGDIVSSLDVSEMLRQHRSRGGIGTIALWRVEDPSAYGVAALDGHRITSFQEKPPPGEELSDLINAGVYVFEPEVLEHIPDGVVSLEKEVFPRILDLGMNGHLFEGHWVDCGTRSSYLEAQNVLLRAAGPEENVFCEGAQVSSGAQLEDCAVLSRAEVAPGAVLRRTIVCPGAKVGAGQKVYDKIYR